MKKGHIKYYIIIFLAIISFLVVKKARKLLALKKAKIDFQGFKLVSIITADSLEKGITTETQLKIQNYSSYNYDLQQLQVDLYTPSGHILATQKDPIKPIEIGKETSTIVRIYHNVKGDDFILLLQENDYVKEDDSLTDTALKLISLDLTGVKLTAKGFVIIDGLEIPFEQEIQL